MELLKKSIKFSFDVLEEDYEEFDKWAKIHSCTVPKEGRYFIWSFVPLGIGTALKIECACGECLDLTKTENW